MVFRNFGTVLKISSPVIVYILLGFILFPMPQSFAGVTGHSFFPGANVPIRSAPGAGTLVGLFWQWLGLFCAYWVAVAWHRYVLLEEYPGTVLPALHGGRVLAYFGRSLLLGIVLVLPLMVMAIAAANLVGGRGAGWPVGLIVLFVVAVVAFFWASMRLSLVLPAAAIGESLGLAGAWEATQPISLHLFGLLGLFFGLGLVFGIVLVVLFLLSPLVALIALAVIQWFLLVAGLSVLTTLYGVYVEGREIG